MTQEGKLKLRTKLRTRLATVKSACLAKLPSCEATFKQHVLRASLQTYVWYRAIQTQPLEQTALPLQVQVRSCKKS
jgi:hypothetical protein